MSLTWTKMPDWPGYYESTDGRFAIERQTRADQLAIGLEDDEGGFRRTRWQLSRIDPPSPSDDVRDACDTLAKAKAAAEKYAEVEDRRAARR